MNDVMRAVSAKMPMRVAQRKARGVYTIHSKAVNRAEIPSDVWTKFLQTCGVFTEGLMKAERRNVGAKSQKMTKCLRMGLIQRWCTKERVRVRTQRCTGEYL